MENRAVTPDDMLDVVEMTTNLKKSIKKITKDNDRHIVVSAMMNAFIHCMIEHCETSDEVHFYNSILIKMFEMGIKAAWPTES